MNENSPLFRVPNGLIGPEDKFLDQMAKSIAKSKIDTLGEFLMRLGVTLDNHQEYTVVQSGNFPDIMYTVYKVSDKEKENPLGSITV